MSVWSDLIERARTLLFRTREDRELDEEIEFHLRMEETRLQASGLPVEEARRQARLEFGGGDRIKEEVRDARGTGWIDRLRADLGFALRSLGHNRTFAAVTIAVLALGIGANTATFTLINGLLLEKLPVADPDGLVTVGDPTRTGSLHEGNPDAGIASYPVYQDLRAGARSVTGLYASGRAGSLDVLIGADSGAQAREPEHPRGRYVSANYFSVLGIPAAHGRAFVAVEDSVPGAAPVVVLSDSYWQRRFGRSIAAIGQTITINGAPLTIVGVTPPGFTGDIVGQPIEMWIPLMMQPVLMPSLDWLTNRKVSWLLMMGRRAPSVSLEQARAELAELLTRSLVEHSQPRALEALRQGLRDHPVQVDAGSRGFSYTRRTFAPTLIFLSTAVGLVLLVVCANVANLMLARGVARAQEMSVRLSLGAGRGRVIQQLLTESAIVAIAGAGLGLAVARLGSVALLQLAGGARPLSIHAGFDGRVLGFVALLTLGTVALFGIIPALRTTQVELAGALRASSRSTMGARVGLTKALVIAQVAVSTLLLVATGMMVRSVGRLVDANLGFDRDRLLVAEVDASRAGFSNARLAAVRRDVVDRVARLPGVQAVTVSENGVFSGTESMTSLAAEGFVAKAAEDTTIFYDDVGPDYFKTLGAHLVLGRDFGPQDAEAGAKVAVVSESMATFFFGAENPLGRHVVTDSGTAFEVVGVVTDVKTREVRQASERRLYLSMDQVREPPRVFKVEVRTDHPERLIGPARRAILAADPSLVMIDLEPLTDLIADSLREDRMAAQVVTLFGSLGLLLAGLGLYGVLAYATVRRTNEFGLRMALGATPGEVGRLVVGEALRMVATGALIGIPGAIGLGWLLRSRWFGIAPIDWPSMAIALVALLASAGLAAYLPAARAGRVAPLQALRAD